MINVQGSKEWLDYRSTRIGSSDAPCIMGVSPYKNIYDLYLEKTKQKDPKPVNKFVTDKGNLYEDLARLDLEDVTGMYWKPEVFVKEDDDRIISSTDGFQEENQLFWECKYVGKDKYNNFINDLLPIRDRVSEGYYPQIIHHCYVTGGRSFYFSVVVDNTVFKSIEKGKLKFSHQKFTLQPEDIEYMNSVYEPELLKFLDCLENERAPLGIGASSDFIDVEDSNLEELLSSYAEENNKLKPIKDNINQLKESIFETSLSYNEKVLIAGHKVSVSTSTPKSYIDYEMLVKENPQIIQGIDVENYRRSSNIRTTKKITLSKG